MADATVAMERALRAYEGARKKRAALGALPVLFVAVGAALLGRRYGYASLIGGVVYALGVVCLWQGRQVGRAFLPGVLAGMVPLALSLAARAYGHVCTDDGCVSLCVPACASGGVVAGAIIGVMGARSRMNLSFFASAGALAVMVGSLGCSCVGMGGVVGLVLGLAVPVGVSALVARRVTRA